MRSLQFRPASCRMLLLRVQLCWPDSGDRGHEDDDVLEEEEEEEEEEGGEGDTGVTRKY